MCKDSRFISVKSTRGAYQLQVNMPLSLKSDKADDFAAALQKLANEAYIDGDKLIKGSVAKIDDLVTVYAVSLGIVTIDRKNMYGVAPMNAELIAAAYEKSDKKTAREDLEKAVQRIAADNEWCEAFTWKISNNHVNRMASGKTERHDRVNKRNSQTGNIDRVGRVDVRAWCDGVRDLTQAKMQIVKTFV